MINHISPLYTVAEICSVMLIIVLLVGICLVDWQMIYLKFKSRRYRRQSERNKYDLEWIDPDKCEESR